VFWFGHAQDCETNATVWSNFNDECVSNGDFSQICADNYVLHCFLNFDFVFLAGAEKLEGNMKVSFLTCGGEGTVNLKSYDKKFGRDGLRIANDDSHGQM
jgi:hypothetical protein